MFSKKRTYLDWAAAAPASARASRAFWCASAVSGNPGSPHAEGRAAKAILEDARTRIARLAGTKPDAVIFTSGATEANALAIEGQVRALTENGRAAASLHILFLPSAHASTIGTLRALEKEGVMIEALALKEGKIDLAALKGQVRPETVLVCLEAVCGETGVQFDVRNVRRVLDAQAGDGPRVRIHADASQAPFVQPFELNRLGADTLSLDAQKVQGLRGIGALAAPRQVPLLPLIHGGGQERGLRPGTEAHALAAAFAAALEDADAGREAFKLRAASAHASLASRLLQEIPDAFVNEGTDQAPHILNLSLLGRDTDYLVALLDEAGFAISTRSACETDAEGSRAVLALVGDPVRASSTLRISFGPGTSERDLARFSSALIRAIRFLDR